MPEELFDLFLDRVDATGSNSGLHRIFFIHAGIPPALAICAKIPFCSLL